jgi:hypothetical protein
MDSGQNGGMARRNRSPQGRRTTDARPFSIGSHWRADGAPKASYRSQGDALSMADERRRASGSDLNVYRCDVCSNWHMGGSGARDS